MGNRGNAAKRPYMSQFLLPAVPQGREGELSKEWGEKARVVSKGRIIP